MSCHMIFALLGIAEQASCSSTGERILAKPGKVFSTQVQEVWARMKLVEKKGTACLTPEAYQQPGHVFRVIAEEMEKSQ